MFKKKHLIIFILFPLSILFVLVYYLALKTIRPPVSSYDCYLTDEIKKIKLNSHTTIMDLTPELFYLKSCHNNPIRCRFYDFKKDKTIIFVHGYTSNLCNSLKFIPLFYKLGFNILMFDQRFHGESSGNCITFGYYEKKDLEIVVDWAIRKQYTTIGLFGQSMGAATILQYLPLTKEIDFAITDCPYSDLREEMIHSIKISRPFLPARIIMLIADIYFRLFGKFSCTYVTPIRDIAEIDIPLLLIHGERDIFVPTYMSYKLYEAKKDKKQLVIIPKAKHANSYDTNPKLYAKEVNHFLKRFRFI